MNDRVTCEAVMAAFVDTDQLGNQQLFDEVAKQLGIPDEVRHASAPVGRAGKQTSWQLEVAGEGVLVPAIPATSN